MDILYKIFDWNDGVDDGLDLSTITLLVKTCFERNMYYWPSHELANTVELSFDNTVSMVYQAFYSCDEQID